MAEARDTCYTLTFYEAFHFFFKSSIFHLKKLSFCSVFLVNGKRNLNNRIIGLEVYYEKNIDSTTKTKMIFFDDFGFKGNPGHSEKYFGWRVPVPPYCSLRRCNTFFFPRGSKPLVELYTKSTSPKMLIFEIKTKVAIRWTPPPLSPMAQVYSYRHTRIKNDLIFQKNNSVKMGQGAPFFRKYIYIYIYFGGGRMLPLVLSCYRSTRLRHFLGRVVTSIC